MKTTVLPLFSTLWRSPRKRFLTLLLTLCILGPNTTQAATAGAVIVWGENNFSARAVPFAAWNGVTAIAGSGHIVALKNDGSVLTWGENSFGQTTVPTAAQSGVTAIAAGTAHTVALKKDGTVVAWGHNYSGQVTGIPTLNEPHSATATPVTLGGQVLNGVTAIAAGGAHTVALKNDGTIAAWGDTRYGQVSDAPNILVEFDSTFAIASPVTLGGQVLSGVTAIAAGPNHTVALLGTGRATPSLTSGTRGNELILSWPGDPVGFTLQSTLSLTPPVIWMDSTKSPEVIGTHLTIRTPITGTAQFYRLRKP